MTSDNMTKHFRLDRVQFSRPSTQTEAKSVVAVNNCTLSLEIGPANNRFNRAFRNKVVMQSVLCCLVKRSDWSNDVMSRHLM